MLIQTPYGSRRSRTVLLEGDTPVPLGARAFELLVALTDQAGAVVSQEQLMSRV